MCQVMYIYLCFCDILPHITIVTKNNTCPTCNSRKMEQLFKESSDSSSVITVVGELVDTEGSETEPFSLVKPKLHLMVEQKSNHYTPLEDSDGLNNFIDDTETTSSDKDTINQIIQKNCIYSAEKKRRCLELELKKKQYSNTQDTKPSCVIMDDDDALIMDVGSLHVPWMKYGK